MTGKFLIVVVVTVTKLGIRPSVRGNPRNAFQENEGVRPRIAVIQRELLIRCRNANQPFVMITLPVVSVLMGATQFATFLILSLVVTVASPPVSTPYHAWTRAS